MPIYEYHCEDCTTTFEKLVFSTSGTAVVECPKCGGSRTRKLFSAFASSGSAEATGGTLPCGRNSGGAFT
ncbi:MAG: hypothetical protein B6244_06845 [Candidatus Cloacimonetes bacterium 4572_55]|nr:MAG: hypothetical protein B6244_06845 [Candidatus Cloacimonetes bacterium 4572_55]